MVLFSVFLVTLLLSVPLGHTAELNTTNNTNAVSVYIGNPNFTGPDLTVEGLFAPQHHLSSPSGTWSFSYGVRNMGRAAAADETVTRVYLSNDERLSTDDRLIGEEDVPIIAAGDLNMRSMAVSLPSGYSNEYLWLIVKADGTHTLNELNEENNATAVSIHIGTPQDVGVDLIVEDLISPQHHLESPSNDWFVSYGVTNMGNAVSADSGPVRVFLSTDSFISRDDALIANDTHLPVAVGEMTSRNTSVSIPSGYMSGYYYLIVAIGDSGVDEASDLIVLNPSVSNETPEIGEAFSLIATVYNQGNAASTRSNLRYLQSLDANISPLDVEIATDFVTTLGPGGSSPESTTVRISTQGTYWLGGCVDPVPFEGNSGNNCSTGVRVTVGGGGGQCAAQRSLPGYLEGRPATITIEVNPPVGTSSWVVNDLPPAGWAMSAVSDGGVVDGPNVRFGPISGSDRKTLSYVVTPPTGTTGVHVFDGSAAFDGQTEPVCGDTEIGDSTGEYHPADSDSDWMMEGDEAGAYGAAWKVGGAWQWPPNPIPIDHVTNAGWLWKLGEAYVYDAGASPPWLPSDSGTNVGGGSAVSSLDPSLYTPGEAVTVSIAVTPDAETHNHAVEDGPPSGWSVSEISSAGEWDVVNRRVKWGPFLDCVGRTLTYTATPPMGESTTRTFVGVASFDGVSSAIAGDRSIGVIGGGGGGDDDHVYWLDTAAHLPGLFGSLWRTDVVARNTGTEDVAVEFKLHGSDGVMGISTTVGAGDQGVFVDLVGLMEYDGKGCLEVVSSGPMQVSGRIYNEAEEGTFGQYVEAYESGDGLGAGESASLLQLRQREGFFRTNISVTNTGNETASVRIHLHDSDGVHLKQYALNLGPGRLIQDAEPFKRRANRPDLGWGFAVVEVISGSDVLVSASVVDSRTNDATTIPFKR